MTAVSLQAVLASSRPADDARVAWALFAAAVATVGASSPMFLAYFRRGITAAKQRGRIPTEMPRALSQRVVGALFLAETIKVALFSALAAWAGFRTATLAGLDAPVIRALVSGLDARPALAHAVPAGLIFGIVAGGVALVFRRVIGDPRSGRDAGDLGVRLTGLFYSAIAIELWFRWGVLAPATRSFLAVGLSSGVAFAAGATVSAFAHGAFAIISVRGAHRDLPMARVLARALLGVGAPSVLCAFALRSGGLECAMFAQAVSTAISLLVPGRSEAHAPPRQHRSP
jgi:hypothetical protein